MTEPESTELMNVSQGTEIERKMCKAISHSTGIGCTQLSMKGKDYCYYHGGLSAVGADSPGFKTGKYSKYFKHMSSLPSLQTKFAEFSDDTMAKDLSEEIAQLRACLAEFLEAKQGSLTPQEMAALFGIIDQIGRQVERQARLAESKTVNVNDVKLIVDKIIDVIIEEVQDSDLKKRIADRIMALQIS